MTGTIIIINDVSKYKNHKLMFVLKSNSFYNYMSNNRVKRSTCKYNISHILYIYMEFLLYRFPLIDSVDVVIL